MSAAGGAFAIGFRELERWDPASFHGITWYWPQAMMASIGSVLKVRKSKVDRSQYDFADLQPITIHFDGSIDRREVKAGREYTMELQFARPGDVVVAKIDLKNGAVGLVPDWENVVVTNHFAVYEPDLSRLVPEYLTLLVQASFFKAYLWRNKVGAEGRKEVKVDFFESTLIPLPPLDTQRAIVARWQAAQANIAAVSIQVTQLENELAEHVLSEVGITLHPVTKRPKAFGLSFQSAERWGVEFNRWTWNLDNLISCTKYPMSRLADVADVNPISDRQLSDDDLVTFVPMAAVSDVEGIIAAAEDAPYRNVKRGYTCFAEQDVIWAKITPCMENGKCAVAAGLRNNIGFGSTEFHVVRTMDPDSLLSEYIWLLLRLKPIRQAAQRYFIGSAGQQRVPAEFLENLSIPLPPLDIQRTIVARIQAGRAEIAQLRDEAEQTRSAARAEVEALILGTQPGSIQE